MNPVIEAALNVWIATSASGLYLSIGWGLGELVLEKGDEGTLGDEFLVAALWPLWGVFMLLDVPCSRS